MADKIKPLYEDVFGPPPEKVRGVQELLGEAGVYLDHLADEGAGERGGNGSDANPDSAPNPQTPE